MKAKDGRDFLNFEDCIVSVRNYLNGEQFVQISNTCESMKISKKEFDKMVKFVNNKFSKESQQ